MNCSITKERIEKMSNDYFYFEFLKNHDWKKICRNEEMELWFIEMMIINNVFSLEDFKLNEKTKQETKQEILKRLSF
jgi:hypothetical protein